MSPVYLNPQQSSSLSFLDLKGDQQLPILGYLHDHVTSANTHAYFSCSSFENHRNSAEFLAMEYSRRAQDKVVEKLFQSHDKLTNNQSQVIPSSTQPQYTTLDGSGCSYIHPIDQGDPKIETTKANQKPKKCKPTKLRIMQRETATEKPKKMKVEHKLIHHDHVVQPQRNMYHNTSNENGSHGFLRMCSDCHTTTTPLWRSGPQGPKSLCNACGIRQRKARRAAMAAAAAAASSTVTFPLSSTTTTTTTTTMKSQSPNKLIDEEIKSKLSFDHEKNYTLPLKKRSKTLHFNNDNSNNNINYDNDNNSNNNNNKEYGFSKRTFPRDEEEGAILLMALSCGLACSS